MYEKFGQFINGKWQQSSDKSTYEVINPANEEILGKASKATPEDVDLALKSAQKGLEVWKQTPPWQRSYIIRKIADRMKELEKKLKKSKRVCNCYQLLHASKCPLTPCYAGERRWPGSDGYINRVEMEFLNSRTPRPEWW